MTMKDGRRHEIDSPGQLSVRELRQWLSNFGESNRNHYERGRVSQQQTFVFGRGGTGRIRQKIQKLEALSTNSSSSSTSASSTQMMRPPKDDDKGEEEHQQQQNESSFARGPRTDEILDSIKVGEMNYTTVSIDEILGNNVAFTDQGISEEESKSLQSQEEEEEEGQDENASDLEDILACDDNASGSFSDPGVPSGGHRGQLSSTMTTTSMDLASFSQHANDSDGRNHPLSLVVNETEHTLVS